MEKSNILPDLQAVKGSLIEKVESVIDKDGSAIKDIIFRIEQPIAPIDPLKWLNQQGNELRIYWSERDDSCEIAGVGCVDVISGNSMEEFDVLFEKMRSNLNPEFWNMRYYGGCQFDENAKRDSIWDDFGAFCFVIPQFEIIRDWQGTRLAVNLKHSQLQRSYDSIRALFDDINYTPNFISAKRSKLMSREDAPNEMTWRRNIEKAKLLFQQNELAKIVLARMSGFRFSDMIDVNQIIAHLKSASSKAFNFCFQFKEGKALLGASPELLFRREKNQIFTEAVAGTRPRGKSEDEDIKLANVLLNSRKDIHEHGLVCQYLEDAMRRFCNDLQMDDHISIMKSNRVQHLYKKFRGTLKNGCSDADILSAIHPTPAVGGLPREKVLREIQKMEAFSRGWYAGPIGWVGADSAEFVVGIRSGLINQDKIYLYAGAGIVPESDPEQEWQELENKISQFLNLFQE